SQIGCLDSGACGGTLSAFASDFGCGVSGFVALSDAAGCAGSSAGRRSPATGSLASSVAFRSMVGGRREDDDGFFGPEPEPLSPVSLVMTCRRLSGTGSPSHGIQFKAADIIRYCVGIGAASTA